MERQRAKARASWAGSGEAAQEAVWFTLREKVGATDFLGYDAEKAEGVVVALIRDGKEVDKIDAGERGFVVLNQTPVGPVSVNFTTVDPPFGPGAGVTGSDYVTSRRTPTG